MTSHPVHSRQRFDKARRRAMFRDILAVVSGESDDLLPFEEVRHQLRTRGEIRRGLQLIPLDKIIGSVGRYRDFTRAFLPRGGIQRDRWAHVDEVWNRLQYIPPIEVYQIGDAYFVHDGNHRVSVARANGATHIEAYVTEVPTKVSIGPEDDIDAILIKAEYAGFLDATNLDQIRPDAEIMFTTPGRYDDLLDHIAVHRYYLSQEQSREIPPEEAVASWYDNVYQPVVEVIEREGALDHFPGRTAADLYLWAMDHLHHLREQYGPAVDPPLAASDFSRHFTDRPVSKTVKAVKHAAQQMLDPGKPPEIVERLVDKLGDQEED